MMTKKDLFSLISKALNVPVKKINEKSNSKDFEEWDSLGQLAIISSLDKKFKGKINKPVSIVVSEDGLYGVKCTPHLANGMVALIAVGDVKVDGFLDGVKLPKKSKARMEEMLAQLGS